MSYLHCHLLAFSFSIITEHVRCLMDWTISIAPYAQRGLKVKGDVDNVDKSIMNGRCWSRKVVRSDVVLRTGVRV